MIYITGDTHGNSSIFNNPLLDSMSQDDYFIIAGDFGFIFDDSIIEQEEEALQYIEEQVKPTVLFIDGNHENFIRLNEYTEIKCFGGRVHKIRKNILHLMRGQVYTLPDGEKAYKIFTMGGGYSVDKSLRAQDLWWPQELPTLEQYKEAFDTLNNCDNTVDYIISHTCPTNTVLRMGFTPSERERPLNEFLQYISDKVSYNHMYFGHWHQDIDLWRNQTCIYKKIRNLLTNEVVYERDK